MTQTPITRRRDIARSAADRLAAALTPLRALIGFDGFVDSITRLVSLRHSMRVDDFEPIHTIAALADRVRAAAGMSTNIERVTLEDRFGGNGPLMAGALARLGTKVTYIGAIGREGFGKSGGPAGLHPIFESFALRCERVIPLGPPSTTMCLEFDDGKVMMNDTQAVQRVTWDLLVQEVGLQELRRIVDASDLLGVINWSLMGGVPGIWHGLIHDVLPHINAAKAKRLFIDISDPAKRTDADVLEAMRGIGQLARAGFCVTLGLNLAESRRADHVLSSGGYATATNDSRPTPETITKAATKIRSALRVDTVVIHPREGAGAASADGSSAWFDGPFCAKPKLSTGAGDHFNGGFAFAQARGLNLEQSLAVATCVSGAYVRDAESPATERLIDFLRNLPSPE